MNNESNFYPRLFADVVSHDDPKSLDKLDDEAIMAELLGNVTGCMDFSTCHKLIIPCKNLADPGVSGIILHPGFHFTCHTFSERRMAYVDAYGLHSCDESAAIIQAIMYGYDCETIFEHPKNSILGGNFGHHLVFTAPLTDFQVMCEKIKLLVLQIGMRELSPMMVDCRSKHNYDILQPIFESHIAAHSDETQVKIDVFSCKAFNDQKILELFYGYEDVQIIPRLCAHP